MRVLNPKLKDKKKAKGDTLLGQANAIYKKINSYTQQSNKTYLPVQTLKYLVCGLFVTTFGLSIFFLSYNYIIPPFLKINVVNGRRTEWITLIGISISRHIAAYSISLFVCLPLGFFLSKKIVFTGSYLKNNIQLFRYLILQVTNISMNYKLLHVLVNYYQIDAFKSQIAITVLLSILSYLFQKYVSFSKK